MNKKYRLWVVASFTKAEELARTLHASLIKQHVPAKLSINPRPVIELPSEEFHFVSVKSLQKLRGFEFDEIRLKTRVSAYLVASVLLPSLANRKGDFVA